MVANSILDSIKQGVPPKKISETISWTSLPIESREALFTMAEESFQESYSHSLLAVLFYLTIDFPWDVLRVLALVSESPTTPYKKKITALEDICKRLDKLRQSFTVAAGQDINQIKRYKFFEADYFARYGIVQIEGGQVDVAVSLLTTAGEKYEALGALDRASLVKKRRDDLCEARDKGRTLFPIQFLRDERDSLQQEIEQLNNNKLQLNQDLMKIQEKLKEVLEEAEETGKRIKKYRNDENEAIVHCKQLEERIQELARQTKAATAGLQFLLSLPRMALAPLWVEVVRLAIQQGEIDDLTFQALQKLSISFPTEAAPLIAQIVARIDGGLPTDCTSTPLLQVFQCISEVASLPEMERYKEAQQLVESWDLILKQQETILNA